MSKIYIGGFILILIGFLAGFFMSNLFTKKTIVNNQIIDSNVSEFHSGGFKFINPLYECNTGEEYGQVQLIKLQKKVKDYTDSLINKSSAVMASVYFRDLNNGPWFGVNEQEQFAPSSLLKLPVMMAFYKLAESNPDILNKKVKYTEDPPGLLPQNFPPKSPLVKGQTYTIDELIKHMITDSDNIALWYLMQNINNDLIDKVTIDLQIPTATNQTPDNFMNVQQYATLFRILYYSTYLNDNYSEKAMELLVNSNFKEGLNKILPNNILVAHKFGERNINNNLYQLHDCGVIFYPNRPYLMCIMTKGPDFNDLKTTIQQISKKVFDLYPNTFH